jgi:hypothetical protein
MPDRRKTPYSHFPGDRRANYWDRRMHRGSCRWLWAPVTDLPRLIRQWRMR